MRETLSHENGIASTISGILRAKGGEDQKEEEEE